MTDTAVTVTAPSVPPSVPLRYRIAKLIRDRRLELGLSQEAVAARAGVTGVTVCRMETGENLGRFETVERVLGAVGIRLVEVVEDAVSE
jgi:transcriptional regulator with XRE-family HTH domain